MCWHIPDKYLCLNLLLWVPDSYFQGPSWHSHLNVVKYNLFKTEFMIFISNMDLFQHPNLSKLHNHLYTGICQKPSDCPWQPVLPHHSCAMHHPVLSVLPHKYLQSSLHCFISTDIPLDQATIIFCLHFCNSLLNGSGTHLADLCSSFHFLVMAIFSKCRSDYDIDIMHTFHKCSPRSMFLSTKALNSVCGYTFISKMNLSRWTASRESAGFPSIFNTLLDMDI